MRRWLRGLRGLFGESDRRAAFTRERKAVSAALAVPRVDRRFVLRMAELGETNSVEIGVCEAAPDVRVRLAFSDIAGHGHALVLGGNGTGKTRAVAGVVRQLLERRCRGLDAPGVWLADHKSEFVPLVRELFADVLDAAPPATANRLLDQLVVIDPFSSEALVPFNILAAEPGVKPEEQAHDVTSLIDRLGGAELGVKQDSFTSHLVLLGVCRPGMSLVDLAHLANDPVALVSAAAASSSPAVRSYFTGGAKIAQASLEGVRARLHRLLRLPSTRLMLGTPDAVSFKDLLARRIVFVDTGSPPLGCEDIGRFWSSLCTLRLSRAIFARRHEDDERAVAVFIDEWQEGLASGGWIAESYERILGMARSRGVSLWLISQSLAGAAKVSSALPKIVATNTNVQLLFRSSIEDARSLTHLLPVTGRRRRPRTSPWEPAPKSPFLSPAEELQSLVSEAAALPDRVFYLWNRRAPFRAELGRAGDVSTNPTTFRSSTRNWRLKHGVFARPIADLETGVAAPVENGFRAADEQDAPAAPGRRRKRT